jgi:BirA family biotin operon repressor/biotin-[acetyl-CoA-carboxylase] ligase
LIAGRKAAGLLIEAAGEAAERAFVLGVGINVAHYPADTPYPATSLAAVCADAPSTDAVVAVFADRFLGLYRTFKSEGLAPLRARWLALAGDLGSAVTVRLETRTLTGIFCDLDADGALILDLGDGRTERIRAGDVFPAEGEQGKGTDAARH